MNILIIIIVATILIAGIGALIYVLIHRSKHKKEVLENPQYNNVPVFNSNSNAGNANQQEQIQPTGAMLGSQSNKAVGIQDAQSSTVMNDIVQSSPPSSPQPENTPQDIVTPKPPVAPASDDVQPPTINHNFPGTPSQSEAPTSTVTESADNVGQVPPTPEPPVNTLDLGRGKSDNTSGNILNDEESAGSVADIAQEEKDIATDSNIEDSKVPVTESGESVPSVDSTELSQNKSEPITEAVPSNVGDSYTVPAEPQSKVNNPNVSVPEAVSSTPSPTSSLEPPASESTVTPTPNSVQTEAPATQSPAQPTSEVPSPPSANNDSTQKNTDDGQSDDAQEMHI